MQFREPEGLGNDLLWEWGGWNKDDGAGRASWAVKPRVDPGYHGMPPERVNLVERILAPLKRSEPKHYAVADHYYRRDKRPWLIARELHETESWVWLTLEHLAGRIEREHADWLESKKKVRA